MYKINFDYAVESAKHFGTTLLRGLIRTIYGALVAGLIAIAVYGFISIKSETGYIAVFDFIAACATLAVAMSNVYCIGKKKPGKRGRV